MNYTISSLKEDVKRLNNYQVASGSIYYFVIGERYGYKAIDLYKINSNGNKSCQANIECGSSKECFLTMDRKRHAYDSYIYPLTKKQLTRIQAKKLLEIAGLNFVDDFYTLSFSDVDILATWAKLTRYKKPRNANGSTARYFYKHLQKVSFIFNPI